MINREYLYNRLLFTEESKQKSATANNVFWAKIIDLGLTNDIYIVFELKLLPQGYCEILQFRSDNSSTQNFAQLVYDLEYNFYPICLYPEFEKRDDLSLPK